MDSMRNAIVVTMGTDGTVEAHAAGDGGVGVLCGLDVDAAGIAPARGHERITCKACAQRWAAWRAYNWRDFHPEAFR